MYNLELPWKDFNINLNMVQSWLKENMDDSFMGVSADVNVRLYFSEEPSGSVKESILTYWADLSNESEEATSYKTKEQEIADLESEKATALASAKTKLQNLGLNEAEIKAILGQ